MGLQTLNVGPMLDLTVAIGQIAADVAAVRVARGLPPLVCPTTSPVAPFLMGQEQVWQELSAPRVVFVPTDIEKLPAQTMGIQPPQGLVSQLPARPFGGRSCTSASTSGGTSTRPAQTRCSTSTTRSNCIASYSAPSTGTSEAPRTCGSARRGGSSRATSSAPGACSSCQSAGRATSPTSPTTSFLSRIRASRAPRCRSVSPSRRQPQTDRAAFPVRSFFPDEVV